MTSHLIARGLPVIDFDLISREVVQPGHRTGALEKIRKVFGEKVIKQDGTLDREALGQIIFNDGKKRATLSRLMKLPIWSTFALKALQLTREGHRDIILDVPLLFESKLNLLCTETVCVTVNPEIQQARLMLRDKIGAEAATSKIKAQWPLEKKVALADTVLENNGTREQLREQIDAWLAKRQSIAESSPLLAWKPTVPSVLLSLVFVPLSFGLTYLARSLL